MKGCILCHYLPAQW